MSGRLWGGIARSAMSPALALEFARNDMVVDHHIAVSGANGTRFNGAGVNVTKACPRLDYDPVTGLFLGWRFDAAAATNVIRNNTMQGANAGANTRPTNWSAAWTATAGGLTSSIAGVGVEDGIEYVDVRWQGTATSTSVATGTFDSNTAAAAAAADTWTESVFVRLISGALPNSVNQRISEYDAGGTLVASNFSGSVAVTAAALKTQRPAYSVALGNAGTAFVGAGFRFNVTNGAAYDFTLRIGLPQMEKAAAASSVIRTTTVAVTRSPDTATVTVPGLTPSQGAFVFEATRLVPAQYVTYSNGTSTESILIDTSTGGSPRINVVVGGVSVAIVTSSVNVPVGTSAKIAASWGKDYVAIAVNGTATVSRVANSSFPTANTLRLFRSGGGSSYSGLLKSFAAYTRSLIPSKLAELTL